MKNMLGNDYATLFPASTSSSQNLNVSQITSRYGLDAARTEWRALSPYQDIKVNLVFNNYTQVYAIDIANQDWAKVRPYDTLYLVGTFYWNDYLNTLQPQ